VFQGLSKLLESEILKDRKDQSERLTKIFDKPELLRELKRKFTD
jgi:hypothetical protein